MFLTFLRKSHRHNIYMQKPTRQDPQHFHGIEQKFSLVLPCLHLSLMTLGRRFSVRWPPSWPSRLKRKSSKGQWSPPPPLFIGALVIQILILVFFPPLSGFFRSLKVAVRGVREACITVYMDQISLKTSNPKCRLFLKLTSKGTWRQVFICLRPPIPSHPPPPVTHCMNIYTPVLIHAGRGGGV